MTSKGKQFKIERKKLVISRERKTKQQDGNHKIDPKIFKERSDNEKRSSYNDKRDAQPLKQFRRRSSSRQTMQRKESLLLQKKSTATSEHRDAQPKEEEPERAEELRPIWRNAAVEQLLRELIQNMKGKQLLFHSQINSFLIQKDYFVHMLEYLICIFSSTEPVQCHRLFHKLSELKETLVSIHQYCFNSKSRERKTTLTFERCVYEHRIDHQDYTSSLRQSINLCQYYSTTVIGLEERIKELNSETSAKEKSNEQLSEEIAHKKREVDGLFLKLNELEQRSQTLQHELSAKTKNFQQISTNIKRIQNYGCENKEIIRMISRQYKEIESDLYEYAVYLQSNEMASQLDYEPRPFTQIEQTLDLEYKELYIPERELPKICLQKLRQVRELGDKVISFYKKKDQQMAGLGEFKTKCVRQFISHMKKWLNNWQLKQQFLVNLRNQFAADTQSLHKCLGNLKEIAKGGNSRALDSLQELQCVYNRIEENYKLGNSFY